MGIFNSLKKGLFGKRAEDKFMQTINSPVFLKDFVHENKNILELKKLLDNAHNESVKKKIENEINLQKYLHEGLSKVYFELKNSPVPFYGLVNLRLQGQEQGNNIDFICVTNRFFCLFKVKSMQGNIEIDKQGSFSRWRKKGEKWYKEGIYSPLEQARRAEIHIKGILKDKFNIVDMPVYSMVVFTNQKATLNFKECSEDIVGKVCKLDLINTKLKEIVEKTTYNALEEDMALKIAGKIRELHCPMEVDYASKVKVGEEYKIESSAKEVPTLAKFDDEKIKPKTIDDKEVIVDEKPQGSNDMEQISKSLKAYRTAVATRDKIPPYYVFNNEEMNRIIEVMPRTKEELIKLRGFGPVKVDKYGEDILMIING